MKFLLQVALVGVFCLLGSFNMNAQTLGVSAVEKAKLKSEEAVFIIRDREEKDGFKQIVENVMKENWYLDLPYKVMTFKKYKKYKKGKKILGIKVSWNDVFNGKASYELNLLNHSTRAIVTVYLGEEPDEVHLTYGINACQKMYADANKISYKGDKFKGGDSAKMTAKMLGAVLGKKTLLVSDRYMTEGGKNKLSGYYPYNIEVVSEEEIGKSILSKNENHLILYRSVMVRDMGAMEVNTYTWYVYQPSDGSFVAVSKAKPVAGFTSGILKEIVKSTK